MCGLKNDGTVVCWGRDDKNQTEIQKDDETYADVECNNYHCCGITTDNRIRCSGGATESKGASVVPASFANKKLISCPGILSGNTSSVGIFNCSTSPQPCVWPFKGRTNPAYGGCDVQCASNTFNDAGRCGTCPTGTFLNTTSKTCEQCKIGTFNSNSGIQTTCTACGPGKFVATKGASACAACPAGKRSAGVQGSTSCEDCVAGRISSVEASVDCTNCSAGTVAPSAGLPLCSPCPVATTSIQGATSCTRCSAGTFSTTTGAPSCTQCPKGRYSETSGLTTCKECPAGRAQKLEGSTKITDCSACILGMYQPATGAHECLSCPSGYVLTKGASHGS